VVVGENEPYEESTLIFVPIAGLGAKCASLIPGLRVMVLSDDLLIAFKYVFRLQSVMYKLDVSELALGVLEQVFDLCVPPHAGNSLDKNIACLLHLIDYKPPEPNLL
jgi:hypothetical protein